MNALPVSAEFPTFPQEFRGAWFTDIAVSDSTSFEGWRVSRSSVDVLREIHLQWGAGGEIPTEAEFRKWLVPRDAEVLWWDMSRPTPEDVTLRQQLRIFLPEGSIYSPMRHAPIERMHDVPVSGFTVRPVKYPDDPVVGVADGNGGVVLQGAADVALGPISSVGIVQIIGRLGAVTGNVVIGDLISRGAISTAPAEIVREQNPWTAAPLPPRLTRDELRNVERRRVVLEEFGVDKFLELYGNRMEVLDEDEKGQKLLCIDSWFTFVQVRDSTRPDRLYHLRVPPGMTNVRQAVAWTFGLTQDDYEPEVET